ncbi:MAG: polysaccharide biosynthesis protein [Bacteroidota bacterium]
MVALLVGLDALLVLGCFELAFRLRFSSWDLSAIPNLDLTAALVITFLTYMAGLVFSGLYRYGIHGVHLPEFLRSTAALTIAWLASVTLSYLFVRQNMAPRSVSLMHWALTVVAVLGSRAVLRALYEWRRRPPIPEPQEDLIPSIYDVLGRQPIDIDRSAIRDYLSSRTVLVTGAGGSIGSVLCRLLAGFKPFRLVLVDVSEYNLYQLENALRSMPYSGELVFRIADVRDEDMMRTLFSEYRPDVIFHTAAYKHVPLMERHPIEAFRNNTLTTVSLIRLCEQFGAEQFVFVSTDKAVQPSSVLGATKRLAEWYLRTARTEMSRKIVRFGNVYGTQGSVAELFARQIRRGGPVTVTTAEMERYFMSAEDACGLILQTMILHTQAPVFMLDMGDPVKIKDLAHRMIDQIAPHASPPIEVVFSGKRPGEKIEEHLREADELPVTTGHPSVIGLTSPARYSRQELDDYINRLLALCHENRSEELRKALFRENLNAVDAR